MYQTTFVVLIVGLSLVAANLPFFNHRLLALYPLKGTKSLGIRLGEMLFGYVVVGGVGLSLEQYAGQTYPQGWEFYTITATMFITFAFPGFVCRYLLKLR